jgi:hypothetical protein
VQNAGSALRIYFLLLIPVLYASHTPVKIVSNLIDPEPHNVPTQLHQPLIPDLIATAQLPVPVAVVSLSVDFDI